MGSRDRSNGRDVRDRSVPVTHQAGRCFRALSVAAAIVVAGSPCVAQHAEHQRSPDPHRDRWLWQLPHRVLTEIGVEAGMHVADVGAGDGYFTLLLAEAVGASGAVVASDIDADALRVLKERSDSAQVRNLRIIHGTQDDPLLPDARLDLVLIVNTIHLVAHPAVFLKNVRRGLKPRGRVVFVQWSAEKMDAEALGRDAADRAKYTLRATLRTIYDGGLEVVRLLRFLPMQDIFVCEARAQ